MLRCGGGVCCGIEVVCVVVWSCYLLCGSVLCGVECALCGVVCVALVLCGVFCCVAVVLCDVCCGFVVVLCRVCCGGVV